MISNRLGIFLKDKLEEGMISAEKVAHVQMGNNLEHALLVLTKCGYSVIPVLDFEFKLHGLISAAMITDSILGLERIEYERLETLKVEDAMQTDFPVIKGEIDVERVVRLLVDHPFLCVVDEDHYFQGIITRRVVLKQVNQFIHAPVEE
ncbi:cyclic-di-AMP-binding protein CbpB [Listeria costaricensis]|uniref:cyclic-di-AMP-binding protein CbpB n=1 Tax=Listeria costaricensis TaxID=2026604 RepID=UPI000C06C4A0|nr:cyclic-di-AMP-binding protein CbpB [Listeria costaricensis]